MSSNPKTISLVLGSGGARGLAHIGVLHWLEEQNLKVVSISGCSMGALIGGVYAAGKLDEYEEWVRAIDRFDILRLLDFAWGTNGLVQGDRVIETLVELVGDQQIEDPLPEDERHHRAGEDRQRGLEDAGTQLVEVLHEGSRPAHGPGRSRGGPSGRSAGGGSSRVEPICRRRS